MRNFDLSPLYRSAIGFDRLLNTIESGLNQGNGGYPPYNVELVDEHHYRIAIAVAGFAQSELEITAQPNMLIVRGAKQGQQPEKPISIRGSPSVTLNASSSWRSIFRLKAPIRKTACSILSWRALFPKRPSRAVSRLSNSGFTATRRKKPYRLP